ncbi:MAG: tetratricopeptide repeat protein [Candidatus Omnitrophica bacterium]|nr:tetratricopeptide repeat protein [Candidatus Omnitrophota bacterium]
MKFLPFKRLHLVILFCSIVSILFSFSVVFAGPQAADYLCEFGITFYKMGRYDEALAEFNKVLLVEPNNKVAKSYINNIFKSTNAQSESFKQEEVIPQKASDRVRVVRESQLREREMDNAFNLASKSNKGTAKEENNVIRADDYVVKEEKTEKKEDGIKVAGIKISGEAQTRMGATSKDDYWKRANWDLNEKNYRMRSNTALDNRENTYDPRIFDRLAVKLNTENKEGSNFYSNIVVDPWSFTGKSARTTVHSAFGDSADIELKYWSNTGYTINQTVDTNRFGNSFNLPEMKVKNNQTDATTISGGFTDPSSDTFQIPSLKIYRQFQPVRELWYDYNQDNLKFRAYPIAYENQAVTFDDPLRLSNNRIWWENSPWLNKWTRGTVNNAGADFTKGYWDNTLSFYTRDSEGQRLTALRGFNFDYSLGEKTSITTNIASPKDLWQDYSVMDNFLTATRVKQSIMDNLAVGFTATTRIGYNQPDNMNVDAQNYVGAMDLGFEPIEGIKTTAEFAYSNSSNDTTQSDFQTKENGNAYQFAILGRFPSASIMDTKYDYFGIQPEEGERFFTKFRIFAARMDKSFDEPLSSYVETRDDEWWSRHIHFRKPFQYYYQGEGQGLSWDDVRNYGVGNGIDIGRSTFGLRVESLLWDKKVSNLVDVRNVHSSEGKFIENVFRDEFSWEVNDKLTTKGLGIYQKMHQTYGNKDPFIFNPVSREYYVNTYIEDNKDPSIVTSSLGAEYQFLDWISLNGIWEFTNDISLAYDNFPRGILNDGSNSLLTYQNGNAYRDVLNFLTDQQHFARAPYPYYNIFKAGLRLSPLDNLQLYLDYTRNPFEKAGQVDDNMNHVGFEVSYAPMKKLAIFLKYTYSRWQDLDNIVQNINKVTGHHNAFVELIYRKSENEDFSFQYGEASRDPYMGGVLDIGWDPYGGSLRTIDTQQIFRLYYRKKF